MNDIRAWLNGVEEGQEWPDIYKHAPTYLSRAYCIIDHINTRNEILRLGQRMTTLEEFENAPVGATATHPDGIRVVIRTGDETDGLPWVCTTYGELFCNEELAEWGYALDLPTRDEVRRVLEDTFWPFLAHSPNDPEIFWGQATDAVLALFRERDK